MGLLKGISMIILNNDLKVNYGKIFNLNFFFVFSLSSRDFAVTSETVNHTIHSDGDRFRNLIFNYSRAIVVITVRCDGMWFPSSGCSKFPLIEAEFKVISTD